MRLLQKDGLYFQIGLREWKHDYGSTSNLWFNIIKVLDDKYVISTGSFVPLIEIDDRGNIFIKNEIFNKQNNIKINVFDNFKIDLTDLNNLNPQNIFKKIKKHDDVFYIFLEKYKDFEKSSIDMDFNILRNIKSKIWL